MSCLYIVEINPFSVPLFASISSYSVGCLFVLFMVSFAVQKALSLFRSHFLILKIFIILGGGSKKILLWFTLRSVCPLFSSRSFIESGLTFRSLIHFEFIFVYDARECSNFILMTCSCPFFPAPLIAETVFSLLCILTSFVID